MHDLVLPFDRPADVQGVVSVAYRNQCGTSSALVLVSAGRAVICEHGERRLVDDYPEGFRLATDPSSMCAHCAKAKGLAKPVS